MSQKSLAAVLRGLIAVHGRMTDSFVGHGGYYKNSGCESVSFRVHIPVGEEENFEKVSGHKLIEPPQPNLGLAPRS